MYHAVGGGVQRRGLHAGLIPTSATTNSSECPTMAWRTPPSANTNSQERSGRAAWEIDDYCTLGLPTSASTPRVPRGIRTVSIVDTLLSGHDSVSSSSSRVSPSHRSRGRTPDWIKRIFELAKRGNLEQLRASLRDMDSTLIRNLSDHHGNNLLHVLAAQGHAPALAWLCAALGGQLDGALADQNKSGLTPAACAVKYGQTTCVEWLVTNTRLRDSLRTRDGERCLLHTAAKYSQESVVRWLVQSMKSRHLSLDQRDQSGDTPLHLSARAGAFECCRILLTSGADVSIKNEAGLRPADVAMESELRNYLTLFEASLGVASELSRTQVQLESLQNDATQLRGFLRDVLSVGKRLAKERDELCRDGRLHAQEQLTLELIQENRILRERLGLEVDNTIPLIARPSSEKLVEGLADMEHRLMLADEGWRRLQHRTCFPNSTNSTEKPPIDLLMKHLNVTDERNLELTDERRLSYIHDDRLIRSLSSSESSIDTLLQQDNIYTQLLDVPSRNNKLTTLTSESGNTSVLEVIEPSETCSSNTYSNIVEPPDLLIGTLQDEIETPTSTVAKKRTFLQKFSLKTSWTSSSNSKRNKLKNYGRSMSADDFKETYLRNSPSSGEDTTVSGSNKSSTTATVEADHEPHQSTSSMVPEKTSVIETKDETTEGEKLKQIEAMSVTASEDSGCLVARPGSSAAHQHHHHHQIESMSVTTSEDSGCIVARPSSAASKSESMLSSRLDTSSSASFKIFPLRLTSEGRVSPAPSDASKPSSLLGKIEESEDQLPAPETTQIKSEKKGRNRAWYDLSDEEPDLLSTTALVGRNSSDDEPCTV